MGKVLLILSTSYFFIIFSAVGQVWDCNIFELENDIFTQYLLKKEDMISSQERLNINEFWERNYDSCFLPQENITHNDLDSSYYLLSLLRWKTNCSFFKLLKINRIDCGQHTKFIRVLENPAFSNLSSAYLLYFDEKKESYIFRKKTIDSRLTNLTICDIQVSKVVGDSLFQEFTSFFWEEGTYEDLDNMRKTNVARMDSWSIVMEGCMKFKYNIVFRSAIALYEPEMAKFYSRFRSLDQ